MEMSSRERVLAALSLEEPDRVPQIELNIDLDFGIALLGADKFDARQEAQSALQEGNPFNLEEAIRVSEALSLDNLFYIIRQPVYAQIHQGKDGRFYPGDGKIKTEADLAMIDLPDPYRDEMYAEAEAFAKGKGDRALIFLTRAGLAPAMLSMGIASFALALYDNPKLVEKVLDIYFDWMAVVAGRIAQLDFDAFATADDFAFNKGLMFAPRFFRDLALPRFKRVMDQVKLPWIYHSDGNLSEALDIFVEMGVDAVHPLEKEAMDIRAVKRDYGDRLCIVGNVDLNLLGAGTPEEVDQEVKELIRDLGPGGGYIVCSGNSLPGYLKPDCVLAMSTAVRKYGAYPINVA